MVNNSTKSTKQTITSHLKPLNTENKTTTYSVGNPGSGFGQTHKWGCVKPVKGMTTHTDKYFLIFI
jgi:hypothetical protein